MAIRTIDAPGIEMHEIDKSQYTPAMTGTKVLVTGFANSGEDYIPMIFTSKSAWLNYYGEPDNEAERYFYAASMEVLNQNGVVNCCKLPYENESRDKFVGMKYKLNTVNSNTINTVYSALEGDLLSVKSALDNSQSFNSDVISFFLENCNVTDSKDKETIQGLDKYTDLTGTVNTADRSDNKNPSDSDTFFTTYAADTEISDAASLKTEFIKTLTKTQFNSYVDELSAESLGVSPKLNAFYNISNIKRSGKIAEQNISVMICCSDKADFKVLTAHNTVGDNGFIIKSIESLVTYDLSGDNPSTTDNDGIPVQPADQYRSLSDDFFAVFKLEGDDLIEYSSKQKQGMTLRYVNGYDSFQLSGIFSAQPAKASEEIKTIYKNIKFGNYVLVQTDNLKDAADYFKKYQENSEVLFDKTKQSIDDTLAWSEIRQADDKVDTYWEITGDNKPSLYDMAQIDEYRTDESRVGTNEILIVDKTRKPYGMVPEDKNHKDDKRELIGIIPIITTAANALQAQSMIDVDREDIVKYETIKEVRSLNAEAQPYTFLGQQLSTYNTIKSDEAGVSIISRRLNNEHVEGLDNPDDFFDSLALEANGYFPSITLQADGSFDRENMKKIGLVVVKAYLDASEGNKISFQTVESFVGSLDRDAKNPNTGATTFIDTIVNEQSEYVNIFTNCIPTDAMKKEYRENVDILVMPHETANVATMGFYEGQCEEYIDISESILKALDIVYDKVTDINERDIDVVVDGGISNIAQFIKTVYGKKGFYDPASTDAAVWKCKKDSDVKMWKTVIMKYDNFCKNIRKDCMFIADGPRPYCLQGQKKIVRPSKPTNTIDANILPFTKYLTGINTSYGAGYCDWFQIADEFSGDYFWCPPSIKACGVYIYTDLNFEYWDAPAGLNRGIVAALDVAFSPTNKQAGQIYTKSWNYAINYPQDGIVLEGQKTLQSKPSVIDRVNIRRLMLRLERATYKVLRYVVYEGNTAYTRQRTVDLLDPIFKQAKVGGGLYDYKIVCDETVNTPEIIDRNEFHIKIGLKPTKTIEFIMVDFILLSTGTSWNEML